MEFVQWARFEALGVFTYFPEAGTPAAEFPDQVPDEVKQARREELMLAQQEIAFAKNEERIGSRLTCLVDEAGRPAGRTQAGGAIRIDHPQSARAGDGSTARPPTSTVSASSRSARPRPGRFIEVEVAGTQDYDLIVEQI